MSASLSLSYATPVAHSLARAATPHMDRRAHADRRTPLKPMPVVERSWASHALVAGCLGALLGSTAAFAVLQTHPFDAAGHTIGGSPLEAALPAAAIMAPLFDTTPFVASKPSESTSLPKADRTASLSNESYSEDAAGVPSATYHEPPKLPVASPTR